MSDKKSRNKSGPKRRRAMFTEPEEEYYSEVMEEDEDYLEELEAYIYDDDFDDY